jgi:hypothetical protein
MRLSGRDGLVKWDPTGVGGATAVALISIKSFSIDLTTEKLDVTCFQDVNKVFTPGMREASGDLTGLYDSEDFSLIEATALTAPGWLELIPHSTDPDALAPHAFSGLAYMDAAINTDVAGVPELTGTWMAAGPWTLPTGSATEILARITRKRAA